ncbi:MAG: hypothetical protein Q9O74_11670 [Planctomycetota bacterium]|nr:hypothetical protein [Planctomycetota bacterium]
MTQLQGEISAARIDYNSAQQARADSKSSTVSFHVSSDIMSEDGRDLITTIKAFAETTDDPNVYVLANVPPPAPPGVIPPPGTPEAFNVALLQDGAIELTWKNDNPPGSSGTLYEIRRSTEGGPMTLIDTVGERKFLDNTFPVNSGPVTYRVTAVRSTARGNPANYTVSFGAGGAINNAANDGQNEGNLGIAA